MIVSVPGRVREMEVMPGRLEEPPRLAMMPLEAVTLPRGAGRWFSSFQISSMDFFCAIQLLHAKRVRSQAIQSQTDGHQTIVTIN